jgi:hypothetical protein
MTKTLQVDEFFAATMKTIDGLVPRPEPPALENEEAYFQGVAHGYATAYRFSDEMLAAARQLAILTGSGPLVEFLELACKVSDDTAKKGAHSVVFFRQPESHDAG